MRAVGIFAPFASPGVSSRGKFVLLSPRGEMGTGDLCRVSLAAVRHGRDRQTSGTRPCGDCRRVLWVPGPRGQYLGKIHFIEKSGVQDEGVAMWLNKVLTPGKSTSKSNFRTGPSTSCGPLCPTGGRYPWKIRFI